MARKHTTFLGWLSSVSKQNTQSHLSHELQVASWNTNIIITVQLIAAKAHLKIITAFHLNWVVTLLKCIFLSNYFFVRGKINGGRKWKEFGKNMGTEKLLKLDFKVSVFQREAFWRHRGCGDYCWSLQRSQVTMNVKLQIKRPCPSWQCGRLTVDSFSPCGFGLSLDEHFIALLCSAVGEEWKKPHQTTKSATPKYFKVQSSHCPSFLEKNFKSKHGSENAYKHFLFSSLQPQIVSSSTIKVCLK